MITMEKLEIMIMELFVADPRKRYSIRDISKSIKKQYAPVHTAVQRLIKKEALKKQRIGHTDYCSINVDGDASIFCFAEAWRAKQFKRKNKDIEIITKEVLEKLKAQFYALILFGSYAKGMQTKNSDVDFLLIADSTSRAEELERSLAGVLRLSAKPVHVISMSCHDFMDMAKSKDANPVNQAIGNHIIFGGCEEFYR